MSDKVTIKIPRELYNNLKDIIKDTGFSSVNEFIVYCMRDLTVMGKLNKKNNLTEQEINTVRKRLKSLGYM